MSCIWDPSFRFINRLLLLLLTIRLEGARTTDTDISEKYIEQLRQIHVTT